MCVRRGNIRQTNRLKSCNVKICFHYLSTYYDEFHLNAVLFDRFGTRCAKWRNVVELLHAEVNMTCTTARVVATGSSQSEGDEPHAGLFWRPPDCVTHNG